MRFSALKRSTTTSLLISSRRRLRNQSQRLRPLHTPRRINSTSDRESDANPKTANPSIGPPPIEGTPPNKESRNVPSAISLDVLRGRTAEDWLVMATFLKILQFSPLGGGYSLIALTAFSCVMLYTIKLIIKAKLYEKKYFAPIWILCCAVLLVFMSIFNP